MWDEYVLELKEITAIDADRVFVVQYERARGKGSGVPFERSWAVLFTMRADKVIRLEFFTDRSEALEAAGLSE
jgi:ketosteroid isomerase-like protein